MQVTIEDHIFDIIVMRFQDFIPWIKKMKKVNKNTVAIKTEKTKEKDVTNLPGVKLNIMANNKNGDEKLNKVKIKSKNEIILHYASNVEINDESDDCYASHDRCYIEMKKSVLKKMKKGKWYGEKWLESHKVHLVHN